VCRNGISEGDVPREIHRLEQALTRTRQQILEVQRKVNEAMGAKDASIFDAHLLVLEDPTLIDEVTRLIREQKINAEYAFEQVAEKYDATLNRMDDEYLSERAADMRDVAVPVMQRLLSITGETQIYELEEAIS